MKKSLMLRQAQVLKKKKKNLKRRREEELDVVVSREVSSSDSSSSSGWEFKLSSSGEEEEEEQMATGKQSAKKTKVLNEDNKNGSSESVLQKILRNTLPVGNNQRWARFGTKIYRLFSVHVTDRNKTDVCLKDWIKLKEKPERKISVLVDKKTYKTLNRKGRVATFYFATGDNAKNKTIDTCVLQKITTDKSKNK